MSRSWALPRGESVQYHDADRSRRGQHPHGPGKRPDPCEQRNERGSSGTTGADVENPRQRAYGRRRRKVAPWGRPVDTAVVQFSTYREPDHDVGDAYRAQYDPESETVICRSEDVNWTLVDVDPSQCRCRYAGWWLLHERPWSGGFAGAVPTGHRRPLGVAWTCSKRYRMPAGGVAGRGVRPAREPPEGRVGVQVSDCLSRPGASSVSATSPGQRQPLLPIGD